MSSRAGECRHVSRCKTRFLSGTDLMADSKGADFERIEGWVDGAVEGVVRGWARRLAAPQEPVTVEILIEGVAVGAGVAQLQRADLEVAGKGACAFEVAIDL